MIGTKISHSSIEAYAKAFSAKITERFFAANETINGQQLVNVTPVRQVNFLMLKNLFESWQNETKNIQSPYFDYKNEQVVKALVAFMNVLSQNIMIRRGDFERLLTSSTQDCLYLMFAPFDFFWAELSQSEKSNVTVKSIKAKAKYFKFNKQILEVLIANIEAQYDSVLSQEQALAVLEALIKSERVAGEDYTPLVEQFSQVAGLDVNTMFEESETEVEEEAEDIFSQLLSEEVEDDAKPWQASDSETHEASSMFSEEEPAPTTESTEVSKGYFDDTPTEEEVKEIRREEEESVSPAETADEIPDEAAKEASGRQILRRRKDVDEEEENEGALNRRFSKEQSTLNEQLQEPERKTIADVHGQSPTGKMHESVTVNQRYMFVNELFHGDPSAYNKAIDDIERCESFDDSVELMVQKYAKKLDWNMNSPEVKELLKIIFKRFR